MKNNPAFTDIGEGKDYDLIEEKDYIEDPELGRVFYADPSLSKGQKKLVSEAIKDKVSKYKKITDGANNTEDRS